MGSALAQNTATLTWDPVSPSAANPGPFTYQLYQGAAGSTAKVKAGSPTATTTLSLTGLPFGEVCWNVTAIGNGKESVFSNEACKTFPFGAPDAPKGLRSN